MDFTKPIEHARRERELGMARAEQGAVNACEEWPDLAFAFLRQYAEQHERFPGFFVTQAAASAKVFPVDVNQRAWGGIFKRAMNQGVIEKTASTMPHPKRHACPASVFRSLIYRGAQ